MIHFTLTWLIKFQRYKSLKNLKIQKLNGTEFRNTKIQDIWRSKNVEKLITLLFILQIILSRNEIIFHSSVRIVARTNTYTRLGDGYVGFATCVSVHGGGGDGGDDEILARVALRAPAVKLSSSAPSYPLETRQVDHPA